MFPVTLLFMWLIGLLSVAILYGGGYYIWMWYEREIDATWPLVLGIALLLFGLLGRPLMMLFLGKQPEAHEQEPRMERCKETHLISRPDGTELFVEMCGPENAPVLVLTHGWGMNATEWFYAKRHLSDSYRLVMWDLPGLGNSRGPRTRNWDIDKMAGDLEAVLSVTGESKVVLLGHSIGGMITLKFCELFPEHLQEKVVGVILNHTTYTNPVKTARGGKFWRAVQEPLLKPICYLTLWTWPISWAMNWLSYLNGTLHLMNHLTQFGQSETKGMLEFATRYNVISSPAVAVRGMFGMMKYDASEVLEKIPVPTLVILGHDDVVTIPEANHHIAQHVPHARELVLNPGGHLGLIEKHQFWVSEVKGFTRDCFNASFRVAPQRQNQGQKQGNKRNAFGQ
ncbi:alpha/beta fold hydrolase [Deinococcus cellulosilyticus]|uniref:AB hydrolase-1 domain-containing protein n=1 Tax=Deinococcus cellulosilyticus (strain DSM 18568 / NBRC 106333 / KACC 11606 / 5516J-15) TaxID=1223518 RepID=A0A511N4X4_DEIC1|nr:alpha/beta hydrolase [Deinococcus cellulosilyticus]GEM47904.1 hypothetical protein DC3_35390 [Deinococcus cellulosilyticus NBRC 106333 = KACC 11606]